MDHFLTITEAAELLKVSKTSLRRWTNDGRLQCYRVGHRGERRFSQKDLLAFIYGSDEPIRSDEPIGSNEPIDISRGSAKERKNHHAEASSKLRPPYHLCTMFKDDEEQWREIRPYLLSHLKPGAQTVYVHQSDQNRLLDRLRGEKLDGQSLIEQGRLQMVSYRNSFLLGDNFEPDRMLDFWGSMIRRYSSATTKKLLLTGEMGWCASGLPGCDQLMQYEADLDDLVQNCPWVTIVCQYPLAKIPASIIFDNLVCHHYVQSTEKLVVGLDSQSLVW